MKKIFIVILLITVYLSGSTQDEIIYKEKKDGFYQNSILKGIKAYENSLKPEKSSKYLSIDFDNYEFPTDVEKYKSYWHNEPLSQGKTGTCWCYAAVSLLESEIKRIHDKEVKLSEMYIVYWEYVARARYFVQHRGDMYYGQGSEANAVTRIIKEQGLVPASAYSGMLKGQKFHNHDKMAKEIKAYLHNIKANNMWDEEVVVSNVKSILNYYLGTPPEKVKVKGDEISPMEYMQNSLKINPDDYFCFMSTKSKTYNQKGELEEPDNWWHNDDYYNLRLDDFFSLMTGALDNGYSVAVCGDVSEPGYDRYAEVGIVPTFDIPEEYINEDSREFRIYNGSSTDDHCIHFVGYTEKDGKTWFMIKDSSSSGFDGPNKATGLCGKIM